MTFFFFLKNINERERQTEALEGGFVQYKNN